jgi:hypothetical protein
VRTPAATAALIAAREGRIISASALMARAFFRTLRVWRSLSENTFNAALRRLGYAEDDMTAHGFRAAASSILNESGRWNPDAIEAEFARVEGDAVRRAYARAEFWDERVRMMQWWADRLTESTARVP